MDFKTLDALSELSSLAYDRGSTLSSAFSSDISNERLETGWRYLTPLELGLAGDAHFDGHGYYDVLNSSAYVAINDTTHQLVLVFRGTDDPADWLVQNLAEIPLGALNATLIFFTALINAVSDYAATQAAIGNPLQLLTTGHSLGGALAELLFTENFNFNAGAGFGSPGMGPWLSLTHDSSFVHVGRPTDVVSDILPLAHVGIGINILDDALGIISPLTSHDVTRYADQIKRIDESPATTGLSISAGMNFRFLDGTKSNYVTSLQNVAALFGGDLNDTVRWDNATATVRIEGGKGADNLFSGAGADFLSGGPDNDGLYGGPNNDLLLGGSGSDYLEGDQGNDTAIGGAGDDIYVWKLGDGSDSVSERDAQSAANPNDPNDVIQIYGGGQITSDSHFDYSRDAQGNLWIVINDNSGRYVGQIEVVHESQSASQVEKLQIIGADRSTLLATYDLTTKGVSGPPALPPPPPPVDHAPVVSEVAQVLLPGTTVDVRSLFAVSDPDGDSLKSYQFIDPSGAGQLFFNNVAVAPDTLITVSDAQLQAGALTYRTGADGSFEAIQVGASDGQRWSTLVGSYVFSNANANGGPANHNPVARDDAFTVTAGTTVTVGVLANDTDSDGNQLSISGLAGNDPSVVSIAPDGHSLTVTTPATMNWPFRFTYYISDGHGGTAEANATITVNPPADSNHAPIGLNLTRVVAAGEFTPIDLSYYYRDPDAGDVTSVWWVGTPAHGALTLDGGTLVTYRSDAGYSGLDTIAFSVTDSHGAVSTFTLQLTVNGAIDAHDDFIVTDAGQSVTFNPLENDTNDNPGMFVNQSLQPQHGTIGFNADGSLTYTPDAGFAGTDRFQYLALDPLGGGDYAWVTIAVRDANGAGGIISGDGDGNTLIGTPVGETIFGNGGDDFIAPGAGDDTVDGGDGQDTVDYSSSPTGVKATIEDPFITSNGTVVWAKSDDGYGGKDTLQNVESLVGSAYGDNLTGNGAVNHISGDAGDDFILGGNHSDDGDILDGGAGNDSVQTGGSRYNTLTGGSGDDFLNVVGVGTTNGVPQIPWGPGHNSLDGGEGNDQLYTWGTDNMVVGGSGNDIVRAGGFVDAGSGDDRVTEVNNILQTAPRTYVLQTSDDEFHLGDGNDIAVGGMGADTIYGDGGNDLITYQRASIEVYQDDGTIVFQPVADPGVDYFDGGDGFDTFNFEVGSAGSPTYVFMDLLSGLVRFGDGTTLQAFNFESFMGWHGDADIYGSDNADTFNITEGNGTIAGRGGDDQLITQNGGFTFIGGSGADLIDPGADWFVGYGAPYRVWGHTDRIVYNSLTDAGDTITGNFQTGVDGDVIVLSGLLSGLGYSRTTPFADGYLRLLATDRGTEIQVDADGHRARETWTTLATIQVNAYKLTGDNFDGGENPIVADTGGATFKSAYNIGTLDGTLVFDETFVGGGDPRDVLAFSVAASQNLTFAFTAPKGAAKVWLYQTDGTLRAGSELAATGDGAFSIHLAAGQYYLAFQSSDPAVDAPVKWQIQTGLPDDLTIVGTNQSEVLLGGDHDDILMGLGGTDILNGNLGSDTVSYARASGPVAVDLGLITSQSIGGGSGHDTLISIENAIGSRYGDTLTGSAVANLFIGGKGNDVIDGGSGSDTASYADAANSVSVDLTLTGAQAVGGGLGKDTLVSMERLVGSDYDDHLSGNGLANTLTGGLGADVLTGGGGKDTFVFDEAAESTGARFDRIADFDAAIDKVDLWFALQGVDSAVSVGNISKAQFDTDLAHILSASRLDPFHVLLFSPAKGSFVGHSFLVIDANGTAGYQAGADLVIDVTSGANWSQLNSSNFV